MAALFALAVLGSMVWMAVTGNSFCCEPKDLLGRLHAYLFTAR